LSSRQDSREVARMKNYVQGFVISGGWFGTSRPPAGLPHLKFEMWEPGLIVSWAGSTRRSVKGSISLSRLIALVASPTTSDDSG